MKKEFISYPAILDLDRGEEGIFFRLHTYSGTVKIQNTDTRVSIYKSITSNKYYHMVNKSQHEDTTIRNNILRVCGCNAIIEK